MTAIALRVGSAIRRSNRALQSAWGVSLAILAAAWLMDRSVALSLAEQAGTSLAGTAPYIAVAVLLIALLRATGSEATLAAVFAGRESRMIVFAALLGGLAPFCSCEVIPFVAALLAAGTPLSAVMAFWLSSPLIDPPALMITAGALGWDFAVGKAAAAVAVGLLGGFATGALVRSGALSAPLREKTSFCRKCGGEKRTAPVWKFWREAQRRKFFLQSAAENGLFLLKWLLLAYLLEALLLAYLPASLIGSAVGGEGVGSILVGALVGAPAYLNSYAAPAVVSGLMAQGMGAGAAMAFLVAGAISSIPAMVAVWSLVRKGVFACYLLFGFAGAVLSGIAFAAAV